MCAEFGEQCAATGVPNNSLLLLGDLFEYFIKGVHRHLQMVVEEGVQMYAQNYSLGTCALLLQNLFQQGLLPSKVLLSLAVYQI